MSRIEPRRLLALGLLAFSLRAGLAVVTEFKPLFPAYYYTDAQVIDAASARGYESLERGRPYAFLGSISQRVQVALQIQEYRLFGPHPFVPKALAGLLGALAVVALGLLLTPVFGPGPALAAAALTAVWPSCVFYTSQNFKEAPTNLLVYAGLAGAAVLMTRERLARGRAAALAAGTFAALVAAGFFRSYVLLVASAAAAAGFLWRSARRDARPLAALGLVAVLAAPAAYLPASRFALAHLLTRRADAADPRLSTGLVPITVDGADSSRSYAPTSPEGLTEFRGIRQAADRDWARMNRGRAIGTQIFPGARFKTWLDVAIFAPKGAFYALFMPLPGLYPMDGKIGRVFAAGENLILVALAALGLAGALRGPKTPARMTLLLFFAMMTTGSALLEFDLGSAGRHKLLYLPMLFPFAVEEIRRLSGRGAGKERA